MKMRIVIGVVGGIFLNSFYTSASSASVAEQDTPGTAPFSVSSTDIINGYIPAVTGTFGAPANDANTPSNDPTVLTNGQTGLTSQLLAVNNGSSVTYTFPGTATLTGVTISGGWPDNGRDVQNYTVSYSTNNGASFTDLKAVSFDPDAAVTGDTWAQVSLTDTTGTLASGVTDLRVTFPDQKNGYAGYQEIDAFGSVTPEPASLGLLGIAALGLLTRRRRA